MAIMNDDRSDIWFFEYSKEEIEDLICPYFSPDKIIGKVIGKQLKGGKQARYYLRVDDKELNQVKSLLLFADISWFKVRDKLYYVRKPVLSAHTAGLISGMHFRETTWNE